jgi:hypothetical protein
MAPDNGREIGQKRRRDRLAASLRENLKRRKVQQRGRAVENGAGDPQTVDGGAGQGSSPSAAGEPEA